LSCIIQCCPAWQLVSCIIDCDCCVRLRQQLINMDYYYLNTYIKPVDSKLAGNASACAYACMHRRTGRGMPLPVHMPVCTDAQTIQNKQMSSLHLLDGQRHKNAHIHFTSHSNNLWQQNLFLIQNMPKYEIHARLWWLTSCTFNNNITSSYLFIHLHQYAKRTNIFTYN